LNANFAMRPFEPDDLPVMQRIRAAAFAPIFQSFRDIVGDEISGIALADADAEQAELLDSLCTQGAGHQLFVAVVDDEITGFVSFSLDRHKQTGEIGLNAVHPDHAGHGIGAAMYKFVMERMKDSGMLIATVGTGGDPSHAPARRAYEKAGFGSALPSLWMYKKL